VSGAKHSERSAGSKDGLRVADLAARKGQRVEKRDWALRQVAVVVGEHDVNGPG
jgi:hypothetical protein